jgi:hypothetical protein
MDMPPFDVSQKMVDLKIDTIAVYIKNKDAVKHSVNNASAAPAITLSLKTKESTKVTETLDTVDNNINNSLRIDLDAPLLETDRKIVATQQRIPMDIAAPPSKG